jgi:hypothetical protein
VSADVSSADPSDGDLARLARGGDPAAFRLLVERHQAMVRARARQLGLDPGDVDDVVQESFLQAFLALDRLRDPDRFAAEVALADPGNHIVTIVGHGEWSAREVTAAIPDDTNTVAFGMFLAGPGRIELCTPQLSIEN